MVYLDYSATTPVDARVLDAMTPYFSASFGNPSSVHRFGQIAESAIDSARETVSRVLNCRPDEVIFTSCGSESDNLAIRGAAYAMREKTGAKWILASRAEHPALTKTLKPLEKYEGFLVEWLDVDLAVPAAAQEFKADQRFGAASEIVLVSAGDEGEARFLRELQVDTRVSTPFTVLLAPPGSVIGQFDGRASKDQLLAKLAAAQSNPCAGGKCGPGGCGPKK